jgi:hypothetical protein
MRKIKSTHVPSNLMGNWQFAHGLYGLHLSGMAQSGVFNNEVVVAIFYLYLRHLLRQLQKGKVVNARSLETLLCLG